MSLLGIDLGTSGVRVAAYTADGAPLASASRPLALSRPDAFRVETDPEAVMTAVEEAIAEVAVDPAVLKDAVEAVSFSVQGEAVVPVDRDGAAIAAAPVSMDRRGTRAASLLGGRLGDAHVHRLTGQPLHPMFSIHKIAAGDPGWTGDAVSGFLCLDGFIGSRLGAERFIDWTTAARTGAFDVARRTWSDEVVDAARADSGPHVDVRMLPTPTAPGTIVGHVGEAAASRTGLRRGTPIVAGAHDQAAAFLGAGGRVGSVSAFSLGTSDCLTVASDERPDVAGTGFASYPIDDATWITLAGTAAGGWALEWFADVTGRTLDALADALPTEPSGLVVLPYLAGSGTLDNDPTARGVISGLTLATTREQIVRGFIEATGYELAKIAAAFAERGIGGGEIRAVGGGSGNTAALAVRSSAAGIPLVPAHGHAAARGAALIAGIGVGRFTGLGDLPDAPTGPPARPDRSRRDHYARERARFVSLFAAVQNIGPS
jgi:sugar (pentulose or hexulose) kinase